ncbi:B-type flagellin [Piscirickettsia salmonis]|uniref:hypothetical protein n=2 Tax=Piscirickettsia salmonis TaxID=1238 RepID=UPI0018ACD7AE|nr:hypothetical protein [Piscirickettsia salmonis]QGP55135.1 B-type flagellin [Piscirickettsia salmonis]QGP59006.1 B-type flagellin [Piscirickettsia salmonis]QGP64700.1 B-type flagellin [Piscirickettsia salmonis]
MINMKIDAINMKFPDARAVLSSNAKSALAVAFKDIGSIDHLKHAAISSRSHVEAKVLLRMFAIQSANGALSISEIAAGALSEQINLVKAVKASAEEASAITETADERVILNQSVRANLVRYENIANQTVFNQAKLLDGSFAGYFLFDDNLSTETLNILIGDTQGRQLGRYVLDTTGSSLTNQILNPSSSITVSNGIAAQKLMISSDQLKLSGDEKNKGLSLSVVSDLSAEGVSRLINQVAEKTRVSAFAQTHVDLKLENIGAPTLVSFNLASGDGATLGSYANSQLIEVAINDEADLTVLLDQINSVTDQTGIIAEFTSISEKNQIRLSHATGANIQLSDYQSGPYGPDLMLMSKSDDNSNDNKVTLLGETTLNRSAMVAGYVRLESQVSFAIQGDGVNQSIFANSGLNPAVFHALDDATVEDIVSARSAVSVSEGALVSLNKISEFVASLKASISDQIARLEKADRSMHKAFEQSQFSDELASLTAREISLRMSDAVLSQAKHIKPLALQLI